MIMIMGWGREDCIRGKDVGVISMFVIRKFMKGMRIFLEIEEWRE